ncbi:hydroxymethylglutaryl-CoA lyase [Luteithermobacter gelatinilyticus]|uniref:hydroxymethylglutaryl-CoA lyase n=1 Tax=Luteithermobacter gelatinilyticus TaxID=2582913 RepID=UPI001106A914|nr:hydroxymethylglutaryl-CoA lyase [Luteithermobacter gelatinilyticus]
MKRKINILEVSPRDGLQSEKTIVSTENKLALIKRAIAAGLKRIEVTSFVNPKRVPQMADAEELVRALPRRDDVSYAGLVLNYRGFERARALNIDEVGCVVVASETFNRRNQGAEIRQTLKDWKRLAEDAHAAGIKPQMTIAASFGCPYEGEVPVQQVINIAKEIAESRPAEIALADTIGVAGPSQVTDLVAALKAELPDIPLRCHFHNSRNTGIANAYAAVMAGVETLDASIGGIGGCPFAPNATGNIATDDLLYMLNRMGVEAGVDLEKIIETSLWLETVLDKPVPSQVAKSGIFPPVAQP